MAFSVKDDLNNKIIYSEINKSNSSITIFYMYSTRKYLEISKYTNLRLQSAALRAMDDDEGVGDGGERYGTSGRSACVCIKGRKHRHKVRLSISTL